MYRIYRNLHRGCWSVQHKVPGKGWRLYCHANILTTDHVDFKVYDTGRERVRKEGRKNVHAFAICDDFDQIWGSAYSVSAQQIIIRYDPYDGDGFRAVPASRWSPKELTEAEGVLFSGMGGIFADSVKDYQGQLFF